MSLALAVILWALAVCVVFVVATVIVGAVIGLVKLARGPRDVTGNEPLLGSIHPRWDRR